MDDKYGQEEKNMTRTEAQSIIMTQTQKAFTEYDSIHGGIVRGMTKAQMYTYADKRTEYANSVICKMLPEDVMSLAV